MSLLPFGKALHREDQSHLPLNTLASSNNDAKGIPSQEEEGEVAIEEKQRNT